ncbi:MAG: succinyl-diaminopimelate desuccinylase [Actinobacteria bacterium]|nr:succinyl-diaminopimelate desuccinylase [Actinomycetota bacterium]
MEAAPNELMASIVYAESVTGLAARLADRTLELVDISSESLREAEIREHLLDRVPPSLDADYAEDEAFFFVPKQRRDAPLVVLAGHYDTVPAQDNLPGRIADGSVHGLGASDMKGGLAVAVELVRDLTEEPPGPYDVALLLFGREELPTEHNPLPALFAKSSAIHDTALAIVLEPTDGRIHAGCLGNVVYKLTFHGTSGHSARPWLADNAITHALQGLAPLPALERREAVVEGLSFYEVVTLTRLEAGIADNVIPDRASAVLNLRYPPDRTPAEAEAYVESLTPAGASLEILSNAPPARVVMRSPIVEALRSAGGLDVEPKQAWTNVADFSANGIDAVNFGPGHTAYAHRRDERVEISALVHAYETLRRFCGEH